ncbi:hypothetical protein TWF225_011547 [Orbilia oligospora]|uniref:Nuclear pore complex protein Nup85 n=1 Tax=Orbilia oligospora TaxID=2813651 RepID=A0A7C8K1D1_ORBOL|nr:hypothetical protein TWF751_011774 [Orbilia oligospora]KAF3192732.1 hypothetical protein TWF225_011547 [Orbilia oligospora]KAF3262925.1 hypothetical protein TWF217_004198 [Orbilia oligospora]KAF3264018.1 hypothetical protein TWF128_001643 [Orbilia oligospora]KAF3277571.1 hypothetical protein TWF132_001633 [Orbilia oligospora]
MFNSISSPKNFANISRSSYGHPDDDDDDDAYAGKHDHSDFDEDDEAADLNDMLVGHHDDVSDDHNDGYGDYEDDQSDSADGFDDVGLDNVVGELAEADNSPSRSDFNHGIPNITEPSEFILALSDLLENAHSVLEPLEDTDEHTQNDPSPIGRHILSETQRRLYLQRLSFRILNSIANCSSSAKNDRLDDALRLASLMLPLYFPPPLDLTTIDLKSNAPLLRELSPPRPAPLILIQWLNQNDQHLDPSSFLDVLDYRPNQALHYDFWSLLQKLALRCRLDDLRLLLGSPRWDVTESSQPGAQTYNRLAASNLQKASKIIQDIISQCPSLRFFPCSKNDTTAHKINRRGGDNTGEENWDTSSLPWRMWRSKIARAVDEIARISQQDPHIVKRSSPQDILNDPNRLFRAKNSAYSSSEQSHLIPYGIAQELRVILQVFLGDRETILKISGGWLEAVAGLAAYHDETGSSGDGMEWDKYGRSGMTNRATNAYHEDAAKKLAKSFHLATDKVFSLPAVRNLQSAIADILAGRVPKALKFLARLSLPVASAAAEILAWGGYFRFELMDGLQSSTYLHPDSLGLLGSGREKDNVKEKIVSTYALALGSLGILHKGKAETIEGWEIGLATLRRTTTAGTRKAASRLIKSVKLDVYETARVERLVDTCGKHGLADEQKYVSESFAQKLLSAGFIGSSLLYFSKAGCNSRIHNVMAGYVCSSLRKGGLVPLDEDIDDIMRGLLTSPTSLVGDDILRREIAGFAALRGFYASKQEDRFEDAAQTLVVLLLSAGEKLDGGILHEDWESVLAPDNIAGLIYELLHVSENDKSGHDFSIYLNNSDIFNVLNVVESLFLVGGETLGSVQEEFYQIQQARNIPLKLDFFEAVSTLRSTLAIGIGNNWLREENGKRLVF